jgi:hypothetical protein
MYVKQLAYIIYFLGVCEMKFNLANVKKIKWIIIIGSFLILGAIVFSIVQSRMPVDPYIKEIKMDYSCGMTSEQREKDFNNLSDYINKNVPFIKDYEELYNIDFHEVQKYYLELAKNAKDDYEYYTYVAGYLRNIPSGHMEIGFPDIDGINKMYASQYGMYPGFPEACDYWNNVLLSESKKYYNTSPIIKSFKYISGEYQLEKDESNKDNYEAVKLISIDNIEIDEFIKIHPFISKLRYDHVKNKPYRDYVYFNNIYGTPCIIKYKDENGVLISENMYYSTKSFAVINMDYYKEGKDTSEKKEEKNLDYNAQEIRSNNIYAYKNKDKNFIYIMFNDFILGSSECIKLLDNADIPDNIIIDLRYNQGGYADAPIALTEKLITKNIEINEVLYRTDFGEITDLTLCDGRLMYKQTENINIHGKSQKEYNIYVLVSNYTLSAADNFASIIKNNNLGTIIGDNNTCGEAYGSPDLKVLETSGIYFYYTPIKWINKDGTDNSAYGTKPDLYFEYDSKYLETLNSIYLSGEAIFTYESRLQYDNVLIETLEIIKEKGNAE